MVTFHDYKTANHACLTWAEIKRAIDAAGVLDTDRLEYFDVAAYSNTMTVARDDIGEFSVQE